MNPHPEIGRPAFIGAYGGSLNSRRHGRTFCDDSSSAYARVIVELKRDVIEFRCQGRIELVEPVLWIVGEDRQRRMVAVGSSPVLTEPAKPIELFGAEWSGKSDREQSEFFEAFWRYNLLKVIGRKLFIRPTVLIRDHGFAPMSKRDDLRATIARTLEMAGAHEVQWDV